MFLYKLIGSLVEIPGIFLTLCLIMFFYYLKKEKKVRKFLLIITLIIYIISTGWFSKLLVIPMENKFEPFKFEGRSFEGENSLIVILGGGVISNTPNDNIGELSDASLQRVYNGYLMYKNLGFPIVVTGGRINEQNIPEALKMKEVLIKMGVEPTDIYLEINARNTEENAKFTNKIAESLEKEKIYLITSAIHMNRSYNIFNKYTNSIEIVPVPVNYLISRTDINAYDFLPSFEYIKATANVLHEILGSIYITIFK